MKRGKKLIILLGILALAVGGYLIASKLAEKSEKDTSEEVIPVYAIDSSKITQISWTYLGETVTLLYDRANEAWVYTEDEAFPVDDTYPQSMVSNLVSITASRNIEDVTDFSEYGLDDPNAIITITTSDGGTTKFTIGDQNANTSNYYFRVNDESTVYLIGSTLPEAFFYELNDIVAMEAIPSIDDIDQIAVKTIGKTNTIVQLDEDERGKYSYTDSYAWYYKQSDNSYSPIDGDMAENIIQTISALSWSSCVDYNATDEELESYGLKNPYAIITVDYTETVSSSTTSQETPCTFGLMIGNKAGSYYYAKLPDSDMVYFISSSTVDTLTATDYAALRADDICKMDWSTVDAMDVTIDGKTTAIEFKRTESTSDDATGSITSYTIDGAEVDAEAVEAFLAAIKGLSAEKSINNGTYSEKGELVIVFHRNTDTFKTMTMAFSSYDSSFYLVSFNGEARQLVNKNDVTSLKSTFNEISK